MHRFLKAAALLAALGAAGFATADILPGNVMLNPDMETPNAGDPTRPDAWFYGPPDLTEWSTEQSVSPTHSLKVVGGGSGVYPEWRSNGVLIPAGTPQITIQWNWMAEQIAPAGQVHGLTLAYFQGVDENGNTTGPFFGEHFISAEDTSGWVENTMTLDVFPGAGSFDIRFRMWNSTGTLYVDDVSAVFVPEPASLLLLVALGAAAARRR